MGKGRARPDEYGAVPVISPEVSNRKRIGRSDTGRM